MKIGCITISDRASAGIYPDRSGPEIERMLGTVLPGVLEFERVVIPDDVEQIAATLRTWVDERACVLVLTTGGTGVGPRDVTPEATRAMLQKELPGMGEIMRSATFARVPTSILSRATAGTRGRSLIVNLPGKPAAVRECLEVLAPALREVIALLQGREPHAGSVT